jgi:hypothetical protein
MLHIIEGLAGDWRRLDARIEQLTEEIMAIASADVHCRRAMSVPAVGPIISSAMVDRPPGASLGPDVVSAS